MKKNKRKFISVITNKLVLISASLVISSIPKTTIKVNDAGSGQTGQL